MNLLKHPTNKQQHYYRPQPFFNNIDIGICIHTFLSIGDRFSFAITCKSMRHASNATHLYNKWVVIDETTTPGSIQQCTGTYFNHHLYTNSYNGVNWLIPSCPFSHLRAQRFGFQFCEFLSIEEGTDIRFVTVRGLMDCPNLVHVECSIMDTGAWGDVYGTGPPPWQSLQSFVWWHEMSRQQAHLVVSESSFSLERIGWLKSSDVQKKILSCAPRLQTVGVEIDEHLHWPESYCHIFSNLPKSVCALMLSHDTLNIKLSSWVSLINSYIPPSVHDLYLWFDDCTFIMDELSTVTRYHMVPTCYKELSPSVFIKSASIRLHKPTTLRLHVVMERGDIFDYRQVFPHMIPDKSYLISV